MKEFCKVKARGETEALQLARERLSKKLNREITVADLEIKQLEGKKGFFNFGKSIYQITLKEKDISTNEGGISANIQESIKVDGSFSIKIDDQGIYLRVLPPEGQGNVVDQQEIKQALVKKEIVEIDWSQVKEAMSEASADWVLIAPRKPELDRDGDVEITISEDQTKVFLNYLPALGGKKLSSDDILDKLKEAGVVCGIYEDKLLPIVKHRIPLEDVLIAEGELPEPGKDAELIYHFNQQKNTVGTQQEDGRIDFYTLGLIVNVEAGDLLVTKKDPEPGSPGKAVTGKEIKPTKPRDIKLPRGKNIEISDENTLIAGIAGQVVQEGNKIHVLPVYQVKGDLDLSVGNIDFQGNVIINGNIREGFNVTAEGNVEVRGTATAANIDAVGNVMIRQGFLGKDKGTISAGGNVVVNFIENGTVKADKTINADAVMHSHLTAGDRIEIRGRKGLLVGGSYKARNNITANIIGSALATKTYLEVGMDPQLRGRMRSLKEELQKGQIDLSKLQQGITLLERQQAEQGKLSAKKEQIYQKLINTVSRLEESIKAKQTEYNEIKAKMETVENGTIIAKEKVYTGVRMTIGHSQLVVENEFDRVKFIESGGRIRQVR